MTPADPATIIDRILREATTGEDLAAIIQHACEGLVAAGLPLWRASVSMRAVDPMRRALTVLWRDGEPARLLTFEHRPGAEAIFLRSPIHFVQARGLDLHRWNLESDRPHPDLPLLEELRADGATEYLMRFVTFSGVVGQVPGVAIGLATRRAGGFAPDDLAAFERLVPALGLACYRFALAHIALETLGVYIGPHSAARVLAGEVGRGNGQTITAAILLADLRGFTTVAGREDPRHVVGWLDEQLDAIGGAVEAHGGEVLKFLGDGLLAVFPIGNDPADACGRALAAAREARAATLAVDAARAANGLPQLPLDQVLHLGDVVYGNIGAARRLDFTVIGPAVNEASRIEKLCDELGHPILLSGTFAARCGAPTRSLGRFVLRGVAVPVEVAVPLDAAAS